MSLFVELKYLLLQVLPSPTMVAQGRSLCIQNHLAMICDSLWAINSMIVIPEILMLYESLWFRNIMLDVPAEIVDWETDVAVAVTDVGGLLNRILDWEASLHRSIVGNTQQVHFRHVILVELKEMLCILNSLVIRGSTIGLWRDPMESMNPFEEDYSIVLKNEVMGREEDLEKLIAIIQRQQQIPSSCNNGDVSNPFVMVIVGEEGVGKTTLAHMIYHHTWICQQFHHRIWVNLPLLSISNMINIIGKEFARSINNEEYCDQKLQLEQPLQAMWEYINERLDGSRYLLVLHFNDWASLMQQEWDELKNILLCLGGPRSVVLIINKFLTEESISDKGFLNGVKDITTYCLNPLSEDASLELFKRHVAMTIPPSKQDKSENDELFSFAKQHFPYLIDRPFFGKILGWHIYDFRATLYGKSWVDHFLNAIYRLRHMPLNFLRFYQYHRLLAVHTHNDYNNVILHMLTAERLIPAEGIELSWNELHDRFCREIKSSWYPTKFMFERKVDILHLQVSKYSTTIPRYIRYLCLEIDPREIPFQLPTIPVEVSNKLIALILQQAELILQQTDDEETTLEVYKKRYTKAQIAILKFLSKMSVRLVHLRILVVESSMIQRLPNEINKLVNLRYLHLSKIKMELLPKSLFELPNLRILSLHRCGKLQKISERIRKLKKLQILKLAYCTKLQRLPKSLTTLKNLEVLNVEGCCWLRELPEDLVVFKSLRVLDMAGCTSLSQMPRGIEQLIGLRKLSGIFAGVDGGFGLAQLQALTNLQEIRLRNLEARKETQTEVLMGQQGLLALSLHWDGEEANESSSESATTLQVLEALRPNVHLRQLEIISYKGVAFPTWMSKQQLAHFDSLVEVRLVNLRRCATLPSLGQLPRLKKLEISGMDFVKQIDDTFYGDGNIFPSLEALTFSKMLALEKWSVPEIKNVFLRSLQTLTLIQCPKLKQIDVQYGLGFKILRVWLNNKIIWSDEFCNWDNFRYLEKIEIVGCQELRCLPQGMQRLEDLYEMTINSCNNLVTLVALNSLSKLYLYACPVLEFNLEAFTNLFDLKIKGCPKMQIYSDDAWLNKIRESRRKKEELWRNSREELEELRRKTIEELEGKNIEELEELWRKKIEEFKREEEEEELEELWRKKIEEFQREEEEEETEEFWRKKIEELKIRELLNKKIEELRRKEEGRRRRRRRRRSIEYGK